MSYPLATALGLGVVLQLALAFAPDLGVGPAASGLPGIHTGLGQAGRIFADNLLTLAVLAAGGLLTVRALRRRSTATARARLLSYTALLAVAAWAYFVSGVDWLAADLGASRADVTFRLVHGYLEWPALLLPWATLAFAITPRRTLDGRLLAAGGACSVALLLADAVVESS
ncbi:MAG TPA: hypothetical protein VHB30_01580, partial [Solirubrobacteraceae bacterium]|nr:hypothetical protein [Solirubrobacteraceae bacterium]